MKSSYLRVHCIIWAFAAFAAVCALVIIAVENDARHNAAVEQNLSK